MQADRDKARQDAEVAKEDLSSLQMDLRQSTNAVSATLDRSERMLTDRPAASFYCSKHLRGSGNTICCRHRGCHACQLAAARRRLDCHAHWTRSTAFRDPGGGAMEEQRISARRKEKFLSALD